MGSTLLPFRMLPFRVARPTLNQWIADGCFPAPAEVINGARYWSEADVDAWLDGRRSGWTPDPGVAARRNILAQKMRGRMTWANKQAVA